jgi:HAD superfamily hydrolase (TIGR01509 family)
MTSTAVGLLFLSFVPGVLSFTDAAGRILRRSSLVSSRSSSSSSSSSRLSAAEFNLLFDCDGVLADTERDGHRVAFNKAFVEKGIVEEEEYWDVPLYGKLLETGGGKERMTAHWNNVGWPKGYDSPDAQKELVVGLHKRKTELFNEMITAGQIPLRPGVLRLVDEAIAADVPLAVCSTSNEKAVSNIVETLMGPERAKKFQIFAGDVVEKKKPSPDIYLLAKDTMGLSADRTMVIEDSHIGLNAAKSAGMNCVVTKSSYTAEEDFTLADAIVEELGDDGEAGASVTLEKLMRIPGTGTE